MSAYDSYKRMFLIFQNEDKGLERAQKASGFVRIEIREGEGRLEAVAQNLKGNNSLILINTAKGIVKEAGRGGYKDEKNRFELEWSFNPKNVAGTGVSIENFDVYALVTDFNGSSSKGVLCPLAAYTEGKKAWRHMLQKSQHENPTQQKTISEPVSEPISQQPLQGLINRPALQDHKDLAKQSLPQDQDPGADAAADLREAEDSGALADTTCEESKAEVQMEAHPEHRVGNRMKAEDKSPSCPYANDICGEFLSSNGSNKCETCRYNSMDDSIAVDRDSEQPGDVVLLTEELDEDYERWDPFNIKRSDYIWWKVTDAVKLNKIMENSNINTPLLFNPSVMMSHVRYRHLIAGLFTDSSRGKSYVILGVPGQHMVERKPFGDMSRWVMVEDNRQRQSFGYWLIYIDPETSKIMRVR